MEYTNTFKTRFQKEFQGSLNSKQTCVYCGRDTSYGYVALYEYTFYDAQKRMYHHFEASANYVSPIPIPDLINLWKLDTYLDLDLIQIFDEGDIKFVCTYGCLEQHTGLLGLADYYMIQNNWKSLNVKYSTKFGWKSEQPNKRTKFE